MQDTHRVVDQKKGKKYKDGKRHIDQDPKQSWNGYVNIRKET